MNFTEAEKEMYKGKKISHKYFDKDEYLFIKDGIIFTEDNCDFSREWINRTLLLAANNDLTWVNDWFVKE